MSQFVYMSLGSRALAPYCGAGLSGIKGITEDSHCRLLREAPGQHRVKTEAEWLLQALGADVGCSSLRLGTAPDPLPHKPASTQSSLCEAGPRPDSFPGLGPTSGICSRHQIMAVLVPIVVVLQIAAPGFGGSSWP